MRGLAIDSPAFGVADTIVKGVKATSSLIFTDSSTEKDQHDALKAAIMALQATMLSPAVPEKIGIPANAVLGMTRPMVEKIVAPTNAQRDKTYLQ